MELCEGLCKYEVQKDFLFIVNRKAVQPVQKRDMSHIVTQHVYILRAVNVLLPSMVGGFLLLVKIITTLYFLYLNQSKTLPLYTYHINCRGVVAFQFQNFKVIIKLKTGDAKNYCMGPFSNVLSCSKYKRLTC